LTRNPLAPQPDGLEHVLVELEGGQDHHPDAGQPWVGGDLPGGGQAVGAGHPDVHEHDVGGEFAGQADGLLTVAGFACHLDVR
jgi:hypothetical protein